MTNFERITEIGRLVAEIVESVDEAGNKLALAKERAETVALLREACGEYGDNEWPDDLYLPDVIEKHLLRAINATLRSEHPTS